MFLGCINRNRVEIENNTSLEPRRHSLMFVFFCCIRLNCQTACGILCCILGAICWVALPNQTREDLVNECYGNYVKWVRGERWVSTGPGLGMSRNVVMKQLFLNSWRCDWGRRVKSFCEAWGQNQGQHLWGNWFSLTRRKMFKDGFLTLEWAG